MLTPRDAQRQWKVQWEHWSLACPLGGLYPWWAEQGGGGGGGALLLEQRLEILGELLLVLSNPQKGNGPHLEVVQY